jgi:hypothetical protein
MRFTNTLLFAFAAFAIDVPTTDFRRRHRFSFGVCLALLMMMGAIRPHAQTAVARPLPMELSNEPFAAFVAEASERFGVPAAWIRAVMLAESLGNVHSTSPLGAMGLMQIMPETWAALRDRYGLGVDPYDAHDNIIAGAAYLRELHDRYGIPGFLAAYNAGPTRWEDHLATGRLLPAETRAYLGRLAPIVGAGATDDVVAFDTVVRSWTEASLFPVHPASTPTAGQNAPNASRSFQSTNRGPGDPTGLAPRSNGLFFDLPGRKQL